MPVSMLTASPGKVPELVNIAPRLDETIESIHAEIGNCTRCKLHSFGRKQVVHTTGNFRANLMFVGEAPGADEDEQGFPFVGRAGQLLTKIIESIETRRCYATHFRNYFIVDTFDLLPVNTEYRIFFNAKKAEPDAMRLFVESAYAGDPRKLPHSLRRESVMFRALVNKTLGLKKANPA